MRTAAGPVPLATVTGDVHSRAAVQHTVVGEYVYDMESGASGGGGGGGSSDGGDGGRDDDGGGGAGSASKRARRRARSERDDMLQRVTTEALERGRWLIGLMLLQSTSSWILNQYTGLLEQHMIVISFLTMLVGAGGNAGAQAAVATVRGIALNRPEFDSARRVSAEAFILAALLASFLGVGSWLRVRLIYGGDVAEANAISLCCACIVIVSVVLGATLPFAIRAAGFDPARECSLPSSLLDEPPRAFASRA
jgi:cation transporter-like permease